MWTQVCWERRQQGRPRQYFSICASRRKDTPDLLRLRNMHGVRNENTTQNVRLMLLGLTFIIKHTRWNKSPRNTHLLPTSASAPSDGFMFPLISVATRIWSVCRCHYQRQYLTISLLLLSVAESLEYFPITLWQRCTALMSLPVPCVHLIASSPPPFALHLPPLLVRLFVLDVATVKQLTIRDLWETSDRMNNTHIQHVLLYLPHTETWYLQDVKFLSESKIKGSRLKIKVFLQCW